MEIEEVRLFRKYLRLFERELEMQNNSGCNCGVTVTQCHALLEIRMREKCNLNELALALGLDKSTVSRTIDGLVKSDHVQKIIPENNRRTAELSLTEKGIQTCYSINQGNDRFFLEVLSVIPNDLRDNFIWSFKLLVEKMQEISNSYK